MIHAIADGLMKIEYAIRFNRLTHATYIGADALVCDKIVEHACSYLLNDSCDGKQDYMCINGAGMTVADAGMLLDELMKRPAFGKRVIYIKNAGAISDVVQNKLLKTIEEPPEGNYFFLEGNENGLLQTIRSRCMKLSIGELSDTETAALIIDAARKQGVAVDDDKAMRCSRLSGKIASLALRLATDEAYYERWMSIVDFGCSFGSGSAFLNVHSDMISNPEEAKMALDVLSACYYEMLRLSEGIAPLMFTDDVNIEKMKKSAKRLGKKKIMTVITLIADGKLWITARNCPAKQTFDILAAEIEQVV